MLGTAIDIQWAILYKLKNCKRMLLISLQLVFYYLQPDLLILPFYVCLLTFLSIFASFLVTTACLVDLVYGLLPCNLSISYKLWLFSWALFWLPDLTLSCC